MLIFRSTKTLMHHQMTWTYSLPENLIEDSMPIMLTFPLMRMTSSSPPSTVWILDGQLMSVSSKSIMLTMVSIAISQSSWHRPLRNSVKERDSKQPLMRPKSSKRSTSLLRRSQIVRYQRTLTGETFKDITLWINIEIKWAVVHATPSHSPKLLNHVLRSNMELTYPFSHLNI